MCCADDLEVVTPGCACILLIINIFLPGIGTIINGLSGTVNCTIILVGILQLLLTVLLIGWIWSIYFGCMMVSRAKEHHHK